MKNSWYNIFHLIIDNLKVSDSVDNINHQDESIQDARNKLLFLILLISTIAGLPIIIIGISEAIGFNQQPIALSYLLFYSPIAITTFLFTKIPYKVSVMIILLCIYLLGVVILFNYAINGVAIPIFLTLFVLSTIFLGLKKGLITIFASLVPMIIIGYLYVNEIISLEIGLSIRTTSTISWITAGTVLLFLGSIIVFSYGIIQKKMLYNQSRAIARTDELKLLNTKLELDLQIITKAEEDLKAGNEKFQEVVSSIATVVWSADVASDGTFENVYISCVADELMGLAAGTINNDWDKFIGLVKPKYMPKVNDAINDAMESPGRIINCEYEVIKANGESEWYHSQGRCLKKDGKIRLIGTSDDITESKKTNEELRKYREHLEELVQERTLKLEIQKADLIAMNKVFVGREFRIKELREEVKALKRKYEKQF